MNNGKEKLLSVGELARKCGVTVRTLQYYDTSGLLVPCAYTEGGRRMYSRHDIIRLQQILFLKAMGFSLEEIRDHVLPADSSDELKRILARQKAVLERQIAHIRQTVDEMDKMMEEIDLGGEIGIDRLLLIMRAAKADNPYSFMFRHFSKEQMEHFFNRFEEGAAAGFNTTFKELTARLVDLYRRNEKPEGAEGQELAGIWYEAMMSMTNGDKSLLRRMGSIVIDEDNWPEGTRDLKEATLSFLRQAIMIYTRNNHIKLT